MANYIRHSSRWWEGPKADWADAVGNMFGEMKKKKTKEELNRQYLDALKDPGMSAEMSADESGNVKYSFGKKADKVDPELDRIKMLDAMLGEEDKQASGVVDQSGQQEGALKPNLMAEALLGERPASTIKEPLKAGSVEMPGVVKSPISSKADEAVSKSGSLRSYMEKLQQSAPEGYEVNPNFVLGGSKEVYVRKQKSDEFPMLANGSVPDGVVPSKYKINPKTGNPEPVEFEKKKDKPITDEQAKAAGFVMRTQEAENTFQDLAPYVQDQGLGKYWQKLAPNPLKNAQQQQYEQAQRNFVNAILRRESGAAISPAEFYNAREQYFPQPGDKADVIAQKAANRQTVIESLKKSAGPALSTLPGDADAFAALSGVSSPAQGKAYKDGDQVTIKGKTYTVKFDENGRPYYEE